MINKCLTKVCHDLLTNENRLVSCKLVSVGVKKEMDVYCKSHKKNEGERVDNHFCLTD